MRFSMRGRIGHEEPEINLIPMIDLFLVIIIFLMQTTTYDRFSELQITLPQGGQVVDSNAINKSREIHIDIQATGAYVVDGERLVANSPVKQLLESLQSAVQRRSKVDKSQLIVVISADAQTTHQSVVSVMQASNEAGISNITFPTLLPSKEGHAE